MQANSEQAGFHGSPSIAKMTRGALNQALVALWNEVLFNTAEIDTLNETTIIGATRYWTPLKTGIYRLVFQCELVNMAAGNNGQIQIVDPALTVQSDAFWQSPAGLAVTPCCRTVIRVVAGNPIRCRLWINAVGIGQAIFGGTGSTHFTVERIR